MPPTGSNPDLGRFFAVEANKSALPPCCAVDEESKADVLMRGLGLSRSSIPVGPAEDRAEFTRSHRLCIALPSNGGEPPRPPATHAIVVSSVLRGHYQMSIEIILQGIDKEIANLTQARNVLSGLNGLSANSRIVRKGKGRFTAAARAKMAAAQKARWAKYRSAKAQTGTVKPIRVMSASARRRIAAAQKARWAKLRSNKKAA
jgi:hypothetical protein